MRKPLLISLLCVAVIASIAQDVYIANPFVQPNDSTLNWYGSGDANGDDTLSWDDINRMQELIDGTFSDPDDRRLYDRADVNGDQVIDALDRSMLEEHLNTNPFFQPSWYWNKLKTREEREEWFQKMIDVADIEETCIDAPPEEGCDCDQFAFNAFLQINGMDDTISNRLLEHFPHDYPFENNCRFNLPLMFVSITDFDIQGGHAMNTIVTGDSLLRYNDLCNYEPQLRLINVQPGEGYFRGEDAFFSVNGPPASSYSGNILSQYFRHEFISKVSSLNWTGGVVKDGTVLSLKDEISPQISTSLEEGAYFHTGSSATITVTDEYAKRQWYSIDGGQTIVTLSKGSNTITLPGEEGDYSYLIYAGDDFYNEVLDTINITLIDATGIDHFGNTMRDDLIVFPNPSTGLVTLQRIPANTTQIDLLDIVGRPIKSYSDLSGPEGFEIDLSGYEAGLYFVIAKDKAGGITGIDRVIKQ